MRSRRCMANFKLLVVSVWVYVGIWMRSLFLYQLQIHYDKLLFGTLNQAAFTLIPLYLHVHRLKYHKPSHIHLYFFILYNAIHPPFNRANGVKAVYTVFLVFWKGSECFAM